MPWRALVTAEMSAVLAEAGAPDAALDWIAATLDALDEQFPRERGRLHRAWLLASRAVSRRGRATPPRPAAASPTRGTRPATRLQGWFEPTGPRFDRCSGAPWPRGRCRPKRCSRRSGTPSRAGRPSSPCSIIPTRRFAALRSWQRSQRPSRRPRPAQRPRRRRGRAGRHRRARHRGASPQQSSTPAVRAPRALPRAKGGVGA